MSEESEVVFFESDDPEMAAAAKSAWWRPRFKNRVTYLFSIMRFNMMRAYGWTKNRGNLQTHEKDFLDAMLLNLEGNMRGAFSELAAIFSSRRFSSSGENLP